MDAIDDSESEFDDLSLINPNNLLEDKENIHGDNNQVLVTKPGVFIYDGRAVAEQ